MHSVDAASAKFCGPNIIVSVNSMRSASPSLLSDNSMVSVAVVESGRSAEVQLHENGLASYMVQPHASDWREDFREPEALESTGIGFTLLPFDFE
jgi:hypothetical protein